MERKTTLTSLAQKLRRTMTKEERKLWYNFLRTYPVQFRRQLVIGGYIVDFYCEKSKLAIELDGSQHYEPEAMEADQRRTAYLASQGISVMRFTNLDMKENFPGVCQAIDLYVSGSAK